MIHLWHYSWENVARHQSLYTIVSKIRPNKGQSGLKCMVILRKQQTNKKQNKKNLTSQNYCRAWPQSYNHSDQILLLIVVAVVQLWLCQMIGRTSCGLTPLSQSLWSCSRICSPYTAFLKGQKFLLSFDVCLFVCFPDQWWTSISSATLNYISIKLIFPQHSQKCKPISLLCVTDLSACVSEALCNLKETSTTTVYASYCCHYVVLKDIFKTIFLLLDISSHSFIAIKDIVYFNKQL